jgi:broad specificity phosphatase PhoE
MSRLVIVRHGNTFEAGEAPRRVGSRTDLPLTAAGLEQARALGRHFAGTTFSACHAGALLRTRQTAEALLAELQAPLPVTTADLLTEIDHGPDENRTEPEVDARIGAAALAAWEHDATPPPGWIVDAPARIAGWRRLATEASGDILCVTSNGAARFALIAFGLAPLKLRTGAYGIIETGGSAGFRLVEWDRRPSDAAPRGKAS